MSVGKRRRGVRGDQAPPVASDRLIEALDRGLSQVYDYLLHRVGDRHAAEDLTSETMLGACGTALRQDMSTVSVGWLIGIARHKLVDHWRSLAREERRLAAIAGDRSNGACDGPIEPGRSAEVLALLTSSQRAALTLRYMDGLSVAEVAELLGRTVGGTEVLLVRAKDAFRARYQLTEGGSGG